MIWFYTILIGFLIGLLARFIKPGDDSMGFILTTSVGILGSVFASLIGKSLGVYQENEPVGLIASIFGAIALLIVLSFIRRKQKN